MAAGPGACPWTDPVVVPESGGAPGFEVKKKNDEISGVASHCKTVDIKTEYKTATQ